MFVIFLASDKCNTDAANREMLWTLQLIKMVLNVDFVEINFLMFCLSANLTSSSLRDKIPLMRSSVIIAMVMLLKLHLKTQYSLSEE